MPGGVELAVYTDDTGEGELRRTFARISSSAVDPSWEHRWREFHRAVRVGGLWVGPPWEAPGPGEQAVVVDPGRAFGTGAHPTTRACLELLATLERGSLLDAGCGSGVVSVAAVRLGFGPVLACDLDPVAVEVARETAARNGVPVTVTRADVLHDPLPAADVVVANVELIVVEALLRRLHEGIVVASGYLEHEEPAAPGWEVVRSLRLEGWAAHVLAARHGH